jgi:zinc/manganese transport system substrate-binding protein
MGLLTSFSLLSCCSLIGGCGRSQVQPQRDAQGRIPVVATYSILADWVKQIGGEHVVVTTLVPADGDPHTFEPTPQDGLVLTKSMLVFENGLHFESWLDDLYEASGSNAARIAVARDITPRKQFCACHGTDEDPHVFHSVKHAMKMVQVIAQELSAVAPEHAQEFQLRAQAYVAELEDLDAEIRQLVASVPEEQRTLITTHNTFGYFADDYGFEVLSVLDSFTSEAADPSAMKIGSIIRRIKELRVPAIFAESTLNSKLIQQVAEEAQVNVVHSMYTDALGPENSIAGTYVGMMRSNAKKIAESLR